jgi:putative FmdB family regulatory protein
MAIVDLKCRACEHAFQLVTRGAVKDKQKCCPSCGSREVRQTFLSFLRNGALSDPTCGEPQCNASYG